MPTIAHPLFIFMGLGYIFGGGLGAVMGAYVAIIPGVVYSVIISKNPPKLKLLCKIREVVSFV